MAAPIETKAAAGPLAIYIGGYLAWGLLYFVPGLETVFPPDIKGQLPFVFGGLLAALAGYFAPHTDRPDLGERVVAALPPPPAVTPAATAAETQETPYG